MRSHADTRAETLTRIPSFLLLEFFLFLLKHTCFTVCAPSPQTHARRALRTQRTQVPTEKLRCTCELNQARSENFCVSCRPVAEGNKSDHDNRR